MSSQEWPVKWQPPVLGNGAVLWNSTHLLKLDSSDGVLVVFRTFLDVVEAAPDDTRSTATHSTTDAHIGSGANPRMRHSR